MHQDTDTCRVCGGRLETPLAKARGHHHDCDDGGIAK
jgi:hypothetical protein